MTKAEQKKMIAAMIKERATALNSTSNLWDDMEQTDMEMLVAEVFQQIRPERYKLTTRNGRKIKQIIDSMSE